MSLARACLVVGLLASGSIVAACADDGRDGYATDPSGTEGGGNGADGGNGNGNGNGNGKGEDGGGGEGGADAGGDANGPGPGPGPRVSCGGSFCRSDQACTAGVCTFPCTGVSVPGDYASIGAAVAALATTGNDATICVKAQQTAESFNVFDSANHNKKLTIIGVSAERSVIASMYVSSGWGDVSIVGLGFTDTMDVRSPSKVTLRALRFDGAANPLSLRPPTGANANYVVEGCKITATNAGLMLNASSAAPTTVTLLNNVFQGGNYGFHETHGGTQFTLSLVNNTFLGNKYAIDLSTPTPANIAVFNNIVANATNWGMNVASGATYTHGNNAFFGNLTNYNGVAVDGPGYVKTDCLMDTAATGIPETKPGSPCRGAGDTTKAPTTDFWNAARGASVDIGAVQGP